MGINVGGGAGGGGQTQNIVVRTRVAGTAQANAALAQQAASVRGLGAATKQTAREMQTAEVRSRSLAVGFGLLRRAGSLAGYTLTGLFLGGVTMGLRFNSTVEQARLAITRFTHSAAMTNQIINQMLTLATHSPFRFSDLITSTRQLMAFNVSAQDTQRYMPIIADAVASIGGGTDKFQRAVKAIGEISTSGILYRRQLNMLNMLGIPAGEIIQQQLGLSPKAMAQIGKVGISSQDALNALIRGMEIKYAGASAAFARTMTGRINALRHYAQIAAGDVTKPLYDFLRNQVLPGVTNFVENLTNAYRAGGWSWMLIELQGAYLRWLPLQMIVRHIRTDFINLWTVIDHSIVPAVQHFSWVLYPLAAALWVAEQVLGLLAGHTTTTTTLVWLAIAAWGLWKVYLIAWNVVAKASAFWTLLMSTRTKDFTAVTAAQWALVKLMTAVQWGLVFAQQAWIAVMNEAWLVMQVFNGELALMDALELANPLTWLVVGAVLLVAGLVILYFKWKWFHNLVNSTFDWIKSHWHLVFGLLAGPFAPAVMFIIAHWSRIVSIFSNFPHKMRSIGSGMWGWLKQGFIDILNDIARLWNKFADAASFKVHIPGFGDVGPSVPHIGLIGERPTGGALTFTGAAANSEDYGVFRKPPPVNPRVFEPSFPGLSGSIAGGDDRISHIHVHINGREVAKAVHHEDRTARARR